MVYDKWYMINDDIVYAKWYDDDISTLNYGRWQNDDTICLFHIL